MWELLERQERLTGNQWKVIAAAILGVALGSLAFFLASFGLGFASASRHVGYAQSPLIQLSAGSGSVLGPVFWGWMADRIGRRNAFIAAVLNVSLASGIMAVTPDQGGLMFLATFFFFAGFGSSGLIITIVPLVQEFVPASKRGWVSGMVIALIASLVFASAQGTRLAVHISWRALLALGLLPALLTVLIRAWVPKSPRWLVRNGLREDARRSLAWALRVAPHRIDLPALLPKMQHVPWHELFKHRRSVMVTCAISLIQIGGAGVALSTGVFFLDPQDWRGLGGLPDARTDLGRLGWAICYVVSVGCDRAPWLWYAMRFRRSARLCARRTLLRRLLRHGVGLLADGDGRLVLWRRQRSAY